MSPVTSSASTGDETRFQDLAFLRREVVSLSAPATHGRVVHLVRRVGEEHLRESPERVVLTPDGGMPGDAWARSRLGFPSPEAQLTAMHVAVAELIANGQPLGLFGDQLFLDLDLSAANLPIGSRVRVGEAICEVTPKPHNGCKKFQARFGKAALELVVAKDLRPRNLRGIYLRVIQPGPVAVGDEAHVLFRSPAAI